MTSTAGAVASREVFVFVNVDFLNRDEEPGLGNVACECPLFNQPAAAIRRRIRQLGVGSGQFEPPRSRRHRAKRGEYTETRSHSERKCDGTWQGDRGRLT